MQRLLFRKSFSEPVEGGGELLYYSGHVYNVEDDKAEALGLLKYDATKPDPIAWPEGQDLPAPVAPTEG